MSHDAISLFATSAIIACMTCFIIVARDYLVDGRADPLNPGLAFLLYFVLYNYVSYARHWDFTIAGAEHYLELARLGLLGIACGSLAAYLIIPGSAKRIESRVVPINAIAVASFITTGLSFLFIVIMYQKNVGLGVLLESEAITRQRAKTGVLTGFFQTLPLSAGICMASLLRVRSRSRYLILGTLIVAFSLFFIVFASRGELLAAFLLCIYLIHYNIRRIRLKTVVLLAVALFAGLQTMSIARAGMKDGPRGMWAKIDGATLTGFLTQLDHLEPHKSIMRGMSLVADGPPADYVSGSSYWNTPWQLLPARLSPWERPEMLEKWYVRVYDPNHYARGGGWGFQPLVEAFFNFGPFGCFLFFGALAFIVNILHLQSSRTPAGSVLRFANCMLACVLYEFMRGSFAGIFKSRIFSGLLPVLFLVWCIVLVYGHSEKSQWAFRKVSRASEAHQ
jgi:hypothetical protein